MDAALGQDEVVPEGSSCFVVVQNNQAGHQGSEILRQTLEPKLFIR